MWRFSKVILKKLLNSQALNLIKSFKEKHLEIWDIAIFGSLIRGKIVPRDIDLIIILNKSTKLQYKLNLAQELKQSLKFFYETDVKTIDIKDIFDKNFLARQAIIAEGYLIIRNKFLSELFGFKSYYIFQYSLQNLKTSQKIMFQYALKGRKGRDQKGIVSLKKCEHLGKGIVKVPIESSEEFKEFLEKNKVNYKIYKGLFY